MSQNALYQGKMIAITTFYNPSGFASRLRNFRQFKEKLTVPLLVVELSFDGKFELREDDAEFLVKVEGTSVLWQKERLLNIALAYIPSDFTHVAWLDCDVILEDDSWAEKAILRLEEFKLIQLFSELVDLEDNIFFTKDTLLAKKTTGYGIAYLKSSNITTPDDFNAVSPEHTRYAAFGLAWAARIETIAKWGFYDAMITGSGDRALACAGYGEYDGLLFTARLNEKRTEHYLRWSKAFFGEIGGQVGFLKTRLYHLWHGKIADRQYLDRHYRFADFDFDPARDIFIDDNGCWAFTEPRSEIVTFFNEYFHARNEDGLNKQD